MGLMRIIFPLLVLIAIIQERIAVGEVKATFILIGIAAFLELLHQLERLFKKQ